jgi:hypothetical protein
LDKVPTVTWQQVSCLGNLFPNMALKSPGPKSGDIPSPNQDTTAKSTPTDISSLELQDLYRAPSAKPGKVAGKLGGGRDGECFALWLPSHHLVPVVSIWCVATIKT